MMTSLVEIADIRNVNLRSVRTCAIIYRGVRKRYNSESQYRNSMKIEGDAMH